MIEAAIESASRKSSPAGRQRHQHDEDHADGGQRQHVLAQPLQDRLRLQPAGGQRGSAHRAPPPGAEGPEPLSGRAGLRPARLGRRPAARGFAGAALAQLGLDALPVEVGQNRATAA